MSISAEQVKELRALSGAGIMDAKQALEETEGDLDKAHELLRKRGVLKAAKKADRETHEGRIEAYIHTNGKIGVLLKLYCETDFVARNAQFMELAHDLSLHIAATNPLYILQQDIPENILESEKRIYREQMEGAGKPNNVLDQIIEGKLKKFAEEVCLLCQPFVKNPDMTVEEVIQEYVAKLGENIQVGGFVRYEL